MGGPGNSARVRSHMRNGRCAHQYATHVATDRDRAPGARLITFDAFVIPNQLRDRPVRVFRLLSPFSFESVHANEFAAQRPLFWFVRGIPMCIRTLAHPRATAAKYKIPTYRGACFARWGIGYSKRPTRLEFLFPAWCILLTFSTLKRTITSGATTVSLPTDRTS